MDQQPNPNAIQRTPPDEEHRLALVQKMANAPIPVSEHVTSVVQRGPVTQFVKEVYLPKTMQYSLGGKSVLKGKGTDNEHWAKEGGKVSITSDGYDWLNRVAGIQIYSPPFVHDEEGRVVPNPIHRRDYIYLRLRGVWWNDVGQMQLYQEDLEVDFQLKYQQKRADHTWYVKAEGEGKRNRDNDTKMEATVVQRMDHGVPVLTDLGSPIFDVVLPADQELVCLRYLLQLRNFGLRYAFSVGKTRIIKAALGMRVIPRLTEPTDIVLPIVGYKDTLTAEDRVEQAEKRADELFGSRITPGSAPSIEELDGEVDPTLAEEESTEPVVDVDAPAPSPEEVLADRGQRVE